MIYKTEHKALTLSDDFKPNINVTLTDDYVSSYAPSIWLVIGVFFIWFSMFLACGLLFYALYL